MDQQSIEAAATPPPRVPQPGSTAKPAGISY
jgi:hypothetical protein